jgi:hypothetical protein
MDPEDERDLFDDMGIESDKTPGWKSIQTDKHGRESTFSQGPQRKKHDHCQMLATLSQHVIRHCTNNVSLDKQREYFMSIKPSGSIDSYLLQGLATSINASEIRDTIPYNPFISTRTLPVKEPIGGDHPVII